MAASTPMNDDWEMVFIDEFGEVVSGKVSVAQDKPEMPVGIDIGPVPQSKQEVSIEIDIPPVAQSKQEVPIEIDILIKEMQLSEKEQKESTEKEPAKPIQIRRPVPDCYRPTYAFKGSYLPAQRFDKQDAPDLSSHLFDGTRNVVETAAKTASNEVSKVDQEFAQYSKEFKARAAEQLHYENSLFIRRQRCLENIAGPSCPKINNGPNHGCALQRPCGLQRPCQMTPFFGMEERESSRSGAEPNNPARAKFPPLPAMMPQPPSVKAVTEERMQHVATLVPVKNMPHPPGPDGQGGVGGSYAAGPLSDAVPSSLRQPRELPVLQNRLNQSYLPTRNAQSPQNIRTMKEYQMQNKMTPHTDGSISQGSAISNSLERKFSLRHNTAIIVFLWEGKEGSDSHAMEKAKAKLEQRFSGWDITFEDDGSFSSEEQKEIQRRHNVLPDVKVTGFVRIGFVSEVDRRLALKVLDSGVFEVRGLRRAIRAWLF